MTELQVFNRLTERLEPFIPLDGKNVRIYACGPTVYDSSHLGHARMAITWDVIQRYLRYLGYNVTFVRNITDVDDKIIKRAAQLGMRPEQLARLYTYEFWHDMHELNVAQPDFEPKATEYIEPMIEFIQGLIAGGHAYASRGDVYFDVASFKEYGKLSKQNLDQLVSGAREQARSQDDLAEVKRSPVDFALWKGVQEEEWGWPSPWGRGRPGWHLECSAMIKNVLGETIDIHGGGDDLVFPHHENEIAQSESLTGKPLAKYWLHNNFVQVNSEKMAKSLGNYTSIRDLLKDYSGDAIRWLLLQTTYRNPIDFTQDSLNAAKTALNRLIRAAHLIPAVPKSDGNGAASSDPAAGAGAGAGAPGDASPATQEAINKLKQEFVEAMNDNFNTARALTVVIALGDRVFGTTDAAERAAYTKTLKELAGILGLTLTDNRRLVASESAAQVIDFALELRQTARKNKDYATSDLIRNRLAELGITIMDGAGGSTWELS